MIIQLDRDLEKQNRANILNKIVEEGFAVTELLMFM